MIAILVATKDEAEHLLRNLSPVKHAGIFHYRGYLAGKPAALYLTRTGVQSGEQVRRFLRLYKTDLVIATGACASLTSELRRLEAVTIKSVTTSDAPLLKLAEEGRHCVSVRHLVVAAREKALLREKTQADILDMETWTLASIMKEKEFIDRRFIAVRVVDDLPGDENYLMREKNWRDLKQGALKTSLSFREIFRFGVWDYCVLVFRKYRVSAAIRAAVVAAVGGKA